MDIWQFFPVTLIATVGDGLQMWMMMIGVAILGDLLHFEHFSKSAATIT